MASDFYQELEVSPQSSAEEIKKAYRRLARRYHPDRNPGDAQAEERFKRIQEAYQTLSDTEKRAQYDRERQAPATTPFSGFDPFPTPEPISWDAQGWGTSSSFVGFPERGSDVEAQVSLSFEQAIHGTEVSLSLRVFVECEECGGRGVRFGPSGTSPCTGCSAQGLQRAARRYRARIPAGVKDGAIVRLPGKGNGGRHGGADGDLLIKVRVQPSPIFQWSGQDLEVEVALTLSEAIRGLVVEVPTLEGKTKLRLQPGVQPGSRQRLRGQGPPKNKGEGRGDIIYRFQVLIPAAEQDNPAHESALEALDTAFDQPTPRSRLD